MQIDKTESGVRVVLKNHPTDAVYCAVSVDCGARDENKNGLVHFIEHMLFKGTTGRGVRSINNRLESQGGELNAFTAKEDLVVHSTVLRADMSKAIDLMLELLFDSTYPDRELEKERGVVEEEIKSYKDNPADIIYDMFEQQLFEGHPLSAPVLGTEKSLKTIASSDMKEFASAYFRPENMVVSVLGDADMKHVKAAIERAVSKYYRRVPGVSLPERGLQVQQDLRFPSFDREVRKRSHQGHVLCGSAAYSFRDERRVALSLLVNMLGGPAVNSILNQSLREKRGLVYTVEANYTPYRDTGVFTVYYGCDKSNIEKCRRLVSEELERFRTVPCTESVLRAAKKQFMGQLAISNDNLESQVLGMGKSMLLYNQVSSNEQIREKIEAVTADMLMEVANDVFSDMSWLIYR